MSKSTAKGNNRFRRSLSLRMLSRFILGVVLYVAGIFILSYLAFAVASRLTFQGNEWYYYPLLYIRQRWDLFLLAALGIGIVVIFLYYWVKTLGYLEKVISATESTYQADDALVQLPSELSEVEGRLNQLKLRVRESQRAAREAEQRKNDLVVYLAHDLKTPLTSVIGYLTLLRDEQRISPELRERYLGIALDKAERLEDLINEFFDITRFSLTGLTLDASAVNLTRLLEQLVSEFGPMLEEKRLRCTLEVPPAQYCLCDAGKMQRVFDNLLRNAVNYSDENSTIAVSLIPEDGRLRIRFDNRGHTIPPHQLERIFEQFYRLDTARTTGSGGAGLGLAIAREIVELHGGAVTAQSENGLTRFEVTLPFS